MRSRKRLIILGAIVAGLTVLGAAVATAGGMDSDEALTGSTLDQATDAALAEVGGGTVVDSETGDDGAAYGVEVARDDGSVVEVSLDENFDVVGSEPDADEPNDDADEPNDD
jgi:hypothetical protein